MAHPYPYSRISDPVPVRPGPAQPGPDLPPAQPGLEPGPEPTLAELASNFVAAMSTWTKAGFPTVAREDYEARSAACSACELWDGAARLGLGTCKAPACGCTKLKRWLATAQCLHPKGSRWPGGA
jgi:hypothetical protein